MFIKKQLVVVGAGFAGIALVKKIIKKNPGLFDITLIDKNDYQLFYPALFKAASTAAEPSAIFEVCAIKLKDIFKNESVKIIKAEVAEILPTQNKIGLKLNRNNPPPIHYDYLVLAPGQENNLPGLKLTSFSDALNIKNSMEELLKNSAKHWEITVEVAGGGLTGCELIANLVRYGRGLAEKFGHPLGALHFRLIEGKSYILPVVSSWTREKVKNYLDKLGVQVVYNTRKDDSSKKICDLVIWTVGIKPPAFLNDLARVGEQAGNNLSNVFVIETMSAQEAVRKGRHTAKVLSSLVLKKRRPRYKKGKDINIIELGENIAFVDLGFVKLSGRPAKWLHLLAFARYMASVVSLKFAINWLQKFNRL